MDNAYERRARFYELTEWTAEKKILAHDVIHDCRVEILNQRTLIAQLRERLNLKEVG